MISIQKYLKDPSNSLFLPYNKAKRTTMRSDMMLVNSQKFNDVLYREWNKKTYFKFKHNLYNLTSKHLDDKFYYHTVTEDDMNIVQELLSNQEPDELLNNNVIDLTKEDTYFKDFWILLYNKKHFIKDKETKKKIFLPVGVIIGSLDRMTNEAIIENIEIIPEFRKYELYKSLVTELLLRISCVADFATVRGNVENSINLQELYRDCGFEEESTWYLLKKN